jgi:fructose-specific phosphotransferase system IIC component
MTEEKKSELTEYAEGWITERKGTGIPGFLKLAYPIILIVVIAYLFVYMNGEVTHSTRGGLVQQLNAVTGNANTFMYVVMALIAVYVIVLLAFVYKKSDH